MVIHIKISSGFQKITILLKIVFYIWVYLYCKNALLLALWDELVHWLTGLQPKKMSSRQRMIQSTVADGRSWGPSGPVESRLGLLQEAAATQIGAACSSGVSVACGSSTEVSKRRKSKIGHMGVAACVTYSGGNFLPGIQRSKEARHSLDDEMKTFLCALL